MCTGKVGHIFGVVNLLNASIKKEDIISTSNNSVNHAVHVCDSLNRIDTSSSVA